MANRYHWTYDYILWGISWANLQLMIADALKIDYKQNSTAPRQPFSKIDLNDADSVNFLKRMYGGN